MNLQWIENDEINLKKLNSSKKKIKNWSVMDFFKCSSKTFLKTWTPGPDNVIKQSIINNNCIKSNGIKVCIGLTYNWTWFINN